MPERLEDEDGVLHIASDAVPAATLYDLFILLCTHARNMQLMMADPSLRQYHRSLQGIHEDMIWMVGILEIAFGVTPGEVIDYSNLRNDAGAFQPVSQPEHDQHERMFG